MSEKAYSGPTEEYRDLASNPDQIKEWTSPKLLKHFLDTRLMIETDSGMDSNALRMSYVYRVSAQEASEILNRMTKGVGK